MIKKLPEKTPEEYHVLCHALNALPGVRVHCTTSHDAFTGTKMADRNYMIWFSATSLEDLPPLLYYFAACHCGFYGWNIIAQTDCGMSPVTFRVEKTNFTEAVEESKHIAQLINEYVESEKEKNDER